MNSSTAPFDGEAEDVSESYNAPSFVVSPLADDAPADERKEFVDEMREIRAALEGPEGVVGIRDPAGKGARVVSSLIRNAILRSCVSYYLVTVDEGRFLSGYDQRAHDFSIVDDLAGKVARRLTLHWTCIIFTTKEAVPVWLAEIRHHNRNAGVAHIGAGGTRDLMKIADDELVRLSRVARRGSHQCARS